MANLETMATGNSRIAGAVAWCRDHPYTLAGLVIVAVMAAPILLKNGDWESCYLFEGRNLLAGETLYGHPDLYPYAPFPALVAVPFTLLPYWPSQVLWYLLNMACFALMIRWSWQLAGGGALEGRHAIARSEHVIFLFGLLVGGKLAWNSLSHHQTDLFIGAGLMGGCLALRRSRGYLAATCFGLAAAMKGPALLFAPYLLWRGRWKEALWMVTFFLAINLLPTLIVPAQHNRFLFGEWVGRFLRPMGESKDYPFFWYTESNQSIIGAGYRWMQTTWTWTDQFVQRLPLANPMGPGELRGLIIAVSAGLILATMAAQGWRRAPSNPKSNADGQMRQSLECSMVLILMLLLSPMSSKPHFGTLLLPGFCVARLAIQGHSRVLGGLFVLVLAGVLLSQNIMGQYIVCVAMWYGTLMWATLLLLIGCGYALRGRGLLSPSQSEN
jgi:Glycosyltransferase family 87